MSREVHVRICEGVGVRFPHATRLFHPSLRPSGPECPGQSAFYADQFTPSMAAVIAETNHRRDLQEAYNREHGITLESIQSRIKDVLASAYGQDYVTVPLAAEDQAP